MDVDAAMTFTFAVKRLIEKLDFYKTKKRNHLFSGFKCNGAIKGREKIQTFQQE